MSKKEKDSKGKDDNPTVLSSEDKEIPEMKPPNDKVLFFSVPDKFEKD